MLINFVFSVRLPVNSRLLVAKFLRSQKLYVDFQLYRVQGAELAPLTRVNCDFLFL